MEKKTYKKEIPKERYANVLWDIEYAYLYPQRHRSKGPKRNEPAEPTINVSIDSGNLTNILEEISKEINTKYSVPTSGQRFSLRESGGTYNGEYIIIEFPLMEDSEKREFQELRTKQYLDAQKLVWERVFQSNKDITPSEILRIDKKNQIKITIDERNTRLNSWLETNKGKYDTTVDEILEEFK